MFKFIRDKNSSFIFTYSEVKRNALQEFLMSKQGNKFREKFKSEVFVGNEEKEIAEYIERIINLWFFNPYDGKALYHSVESTYQVQPNTKKDFWISGYKDEEGKNVDLTTIYNFGIETTLSMINKTISNFKVYFEIWDKIVSADPKFNKPNSHIAVLYVKMLGKLLDNIDPNFIKHDKSEIFTNYSKRNELIDYYHANDGVNGHQAIEQLAKRYLAEYRDKNKIKTMSSTEFFDILFLILKNGCDLDIFSKNKVYSRIILEEEIEAISKIIPRKKITKEFLFNINIEDLNSWFNLPVSIFEHEYKDIVKDLKMANIDSTELEVADLSEVGYKNVIPKIDYVSLLPTLYLKYCITSETQSILYLNTFNTLYSKMIMDPNISVESTKSIDGIRETLDLAFKRKFADSINLSGSILCNLESFKEEFKSCLKNKTNSELIDYDENEVRVEVEAAISKAILTMKEHLQKQVFGKVNSEAFVKGDILDEEVTVRYNSLGIAIDPFGNPLSVSFGEKAKDLNGISEEKRCFVTKDLLAIRDNSIEAIYIKKLKEGSSYVINIKFMNLQRMINP